MKIRLGLVLLLSFLAGCSPTDTTTRSGSPGNSDSNSASVNEPESTESVADSGFDTDSSTGIAGECPGTYQSFIWIANTAEGTLSKVCTTTGKEVARYITSNEGAEGDPSRTSVNLHGDAVVTNRSPANGARSSVTKFAANLADCVDKDNDGIKKTSSGPTDVLPWGEDECMLWNTPLGPAGIAIGARATAWDGKEDEETGKGGHVWIGSVVIGGQNKVYQLNGDTGELEQSHNIPMSAYGGVIDGRGGFWVVAMECTVMVCSIGRVDMTTFETTRVNVNTGYGISVDTKGRIWTSGMNGVVRHDPNAASDQNTYKAVAGFNRGVALDGKGSVWIANTDGSLIHMDEETMEVLNRVPIGGSDMVGVAIDFEGYVWTISQSANAAYKINPQDYTYETIPIGAGPYTYSDMTGMQLKNVTSPVK